MLQLRKERRRRWRLEDVFLRTGIFLQNLSKIERDILPAYRGWRRRMSRAFRRTEDYLVSEASHEGTVGS